MDPVTRIGDALEDNCEPAESGTEFEAQGLHPEYVWFWRRAAARLIDTVFYYIINIAAGIALGIVLVVLDQVTGSNHLQTLTSIPAFSWIGFLLSLLASIMYHTVLEGLHGSSLGKMVLGITVLGDDLRPCGLVPAFLRSIAFLVDGLIFGGVAAMSMQSSETYQRLGDRWANTVVVRRKSVPQASLRSMLLFIVALLGGALVIALFSIVAILRFVM